MLCTDVELPCMQGEGHVQGGLAAAKDPFFTTWLTAMQPVDADANPHPSR